MTAVSNRTKTILNIIKIVLQICWNILFYTVIIIAVFRLCSVVYDFSYEIFGDVRVEAAPGRDMAIEVRTGEGTMGLSKKLENKGIINDRYTFYVRAKLSTGSRRPILPGSYKLNTSMNYDEILSVITNENQTQTEAK